MEAAWSSETLRMQHTSKQGQHLRTGLTLNVTCVNNKGSNYVVSYIDHLLHPT